MTSSDGKRIAFLDPFSGVSGDMLLGSLVDCGLGIEEIAKALEALPLQGYKLEARTVKKASITATKVDVIVEHAHDHRHLRDIQEILERSSLPPDSKEKALKAFASLAEAEGRIHGMPPHEVHFHEVGAVDGIVDIVGTVEGFRLLGVGEIFCGPLPASPGATRAAHGVIPLPAPATLELLSGFPLKEGPGEGELVTPTGAALVATLARPSFHWPRMIPRTVGYGAGSRESRRPNVLRLVLGDPWPEEACTEDASWPAGFSSGMGLEESVVLECNIDDMNPQIFEHVQHKLFSCGAVDVSLTPLQMKKNRPAMKISVICPPNRVQDSVRTLMRETTTIGVRGHKVFRWMARRKTETVTTPYGPVGIKISMLGEEIVNAMPEYEDCRRAAIDAGQPLKKVMAEAMKAFGKMF